MNVLGIIEKKKSKKKLTKKEIFYIVNGYIKKEIPDYQMSAFLMAVTLNGLNKKETIFLTDALVKSGTKLEFSDLVDKHSTGGVGDKTTLLIAPIVACLGLKMVKMSGGGLGHTGGTIDKLEAIQGFRVDLDHGEIEKSLSEIGVCLIRQLKDLAPADKKIYQLRDVTATTNSIALIASSIMSKKIASGAKVLVIDLKVGRGAFVKNKKEGLELAKLLKEIGKHYQIKVICVLSRMDEPIGYCVGNGLEVIECLDFLKGDFDQDLYDLVVELTSELVSNYQEITFAEAKKEVIKVLEKKQALLKLQEIVKNQNGKLNEIKVSSKKQIIPSPTTGYIKKIDAYQIGQMVKQLGGGRQKVDDKIDYGVGFVLHRKIGNFIEKGEPLVTVYYQDKDLAIKDILNSFTFSQENVNKKSIVIAKI